MRRRLVMPAFVLLASMKLSLAATITGAEIVDYGLFDNVSTGSRKEPGRLSNHIDEVLIVKLKERTTIIPATLGTRFGISVKLVGRPAVSE